MCMVDMPPGTSQERTEEVTNQLDQALLQIKGVQYTMKILGFSFIADQGPTYAAFIIKLKLQVKICTVCNNIKHFPIKR